MYLFFDTETTGLPKNFKAELTDFDNWPYLVQIAWLLYDEKNNQVLKKNYIIKPVGYTIPQESITFHGVTNERALREGSLIENVLKNFSEDINKANFLIAHNIKFDEKIVGVEFLRKNISNNLFNKKRFCTMESSVNYCQIISSHGFKWPTLQELHLKLFNSTFDNAHNALVDTEFCAKCFFELKNKGIFSDIDGKKIEYF